jgi:hypothetical protein
MTRIHVRSLATAVAVGLSAIFSSAAAAQVTIDQTSGGFTGMIFTSIDRWAGQSFQQTGSNVAGVGIYVYGSVPGTNLTVNLWNARPDQAGASKLASGVAISTLGGTDYSGWIDAFWSPVAVAPGTTLFFTVLATGGPMYVNGHSGYSAGTGVYNNSTNEVAAYTTSTMDMSFRTYTELQPSSVVPEPVTLILLSTGLMGLATVRRRRLTRVT